jgi:hypothetical protein
VTPDDNPACFPHQPGGVDHRSAGGDDVLHQHDAWPTNVAAFHGLACAIVLGFLPDEHGRKAALQRHGGGDGDATQFQSREDLGVRRNKTQHPHCHAAQKQRVGLEAILVEVLRRDLTRP